MMLELDLTPRQGDGYLNATQMCNAYNKKLYDWRRTKAGIAVTDALSLETGIPASKLFHSVRGRGDSVQQGTWVHPKLAVHIAQWIDPQFALWVSDLVIDWFTGNGQRSTPVVKSTTLRERVLEELARRDLSSVPTDKLIRLLE